MINILVTGSNGQLGSEIKCLEKQHNEFNFFFTDIEELDLRDIDAIDDFFTKNEISVCINCAAYTAVDNAEDEKELAYLINEIAVRDLAKISNKHGALLVHISTDYVFNGLHYKPYEETDPVAPNSAYGLSKLKGEEAALSSCNKVIIIRTSWLFSSFGNNFVKTMIRLGNSRDEIGVVADQIGTPTYAGDLAEAILQIITKSYGKEISQIYHYSNEGAISWYDFAKAIMLEENIKCKVNPIESKDFPAKANRPFYSVLNKAKIKADFELSVPYWLDSLKIMLNKLKSN